MTQEQLDRFMPKVNKTETCWLWTAAIAAGYGQFHPWRGKQVRAHRISYEHFVGPIPDGLQIDHICRVKNCVNPAHLCPVTAKENMANTPPRKPYLYCKKGLHRLDEGNIYYENRPEKLKRICRACTLDYQQKYRDGGYIRPSRRRTQALLQVSI